MRVTNKVSKKVKLSKAKRNYKKHERRVISKFVRRAFRKMIQQESV